MTCPQTTVLLHRAIQGRQPCAFANSSWPSVLCIVWTQSDMGALRDTLDLVVGLREEDSLDGTAQGEYKALLAGLRNYGKMTMGGSVTVRMRSQANAVCLQQHAEGHILQRLSEACLSLRTWPCAVMHVCHCMACACLPLHACRMVTWHKSSHHPRP